MKNEKVLETEGISPQLVMHDCVVALSLQRQSMGFTLSQGRAHIVDEKKRENGNELILTR